MSKLNLEFKVQNILNIEKESGKRFMDLLGGLGIGDIVVILNEMGVTGDQIDEAFKEEGFDGLMFSIMEDLQTSGFLPKKFDLSKVKQSMEAAFDEASQ
jgi:hypothetical protein